MKKLMIFLMISILFISCISATTYYIDYETGLDSNDGLTTSSAWKHCPGDSNAIGNPASVTLQTGDDLIFKGGVRYKGEIVIDGRFETGTPGSPITFKGDEWESEKAILEGGDEITGSWTQCTSQVACADNPNWQNIYSITYPELDDFQRGFYQNDSFLWHAQDPNPEDPFYYDEINDYNVIPYSDHTINQTRTTITDYTYFNQSDSSYWDGAYVIVWRIPNVVVIRAITGFNPITNTITHEDLGGDIYTDRDTYYAVLNHLSLIDTPGEFFLNEAGNILYVWPHKSINANNDRFSYKTRGTGIYGYYVNDFVVEGFQIQKYTYGIRVIDAGGGIIPENITIRNNKIKNLKSNGAYALQVGGKDIIVENNSIINCQRAVGILAGGNNITVKDNYVERASRQGIWFMGARNSKLENNNVTDIKGSHANAVSLYSGCENVSVFNNKVTNSRIPFTFENSKNIDIFNNIFYSDGTVGYIFAGWGGITGDINIFNNIIIPSSNNHSIFISDCNILNTVIMKNNILQGGGCGERNNNIWTGIRSGWTPSEGEFVETNLSKIFLDPGNLDFRLKGGSPAIDNGTDLSEYFTTDIEGISRPQGSGWDIGAYEYTPNGTCNHPADISPNDCVIDLNELNSYINNWKTNLDISIPEVMDAISKWKAGGYN